MFNQKQDPSIFSYYPKDVTEQNPKSSNFGNLLNLLSSGNPSELLKALGGNNPQLAQIMSFLNNFNKPTNKKTTTIKSDCKYVTVEEYYSKKWVFLHRLDFEKLSHLQNFLSSIL